MKKLFLSILMACVCGAAMAQNGFLRGKIIDGETGEGLFGATVTKQGTTQGSVADFDGNFSLSLPEGTHTIVVQFISYQSKIIEGVVIVDGEVTNLDVTISEDVQQLESVVVTAEQIRDNEVALLSVQKKSANTIDGISSAAFKKVGDSDLGGAMKRVTGVSVQGGKYVYVRGLGDRYTKTTLNGMSIPSLDPDKNAVQIDIFPTSTIENVVVYKTFSPDLQGDFTGGAVDVEMKSFPEEKNTTVSLGFGYNPDMHFKSNNLSYQGGKTDFLGFDDGSRELPFSKSTDIPNINASNGADAEKYTRAFSPYLSAQEQQNFMNSSFSIAHGNQIDKGDMKIGYNAILNYQNTQEYYDDVQIGRYRKEPEADVTGLVPLNTKSGSQGSSDVLWSALLSGAVKFDNNSFALSLLRSQNGNSAATNRINANQDDNPSILQEDVLTYTQRSITNGILIGKHRIKNMDLEWRGALSYSRQYEPDFRDSRLEITDDGYGLNTGVGAGVNRYFRDLNESNNSFKVDLSIPYAEKNKLKVGAIATFKSRDFEILNYYFRNIGGGEITGVADDLMAPENIWTPATGVGTVANGNFVPSDQFSSSQNIFGAYVMTEMKLMDRLRAIYGVRAELVKMNYTGADQNQIAMTDSLVLDELDILPSVNLVYELNENMNLRASYNKTLARPTFSEKSNAQIYDPISSLVRIGNLELEEVHVNNYDLRWEYFYSADEMLSVSGFYKDFDGHIEWVTFRTALGTIKPRNSGESRAYGVEFEFRKNIFNNLSFGTNLSLIKSEVDMKSVTVDDNGTTEYDSRLGGLRDGEELKATRSMAGQSPYLINAYFNYKNNDNTINANLSYNVQGKTLAYVSPGDLVPDVYTKEFHSVNFNISKTFGKVGTSKVTFRVDNILGAQRKNVYESYEANEEVFSLYKPGRTFSLKYAYSF
ncbi:TonB-dependent receptor [Reichenbachiella agariperforans]|uniref:TonB-dependent receptor n=1 Tax=Reichenbachiella agariperforans TaxID=156994 RepID=UPI001C08755D|nr:TonB-dependent receptor [Reichenbachiella agariperforans]MBU2915122.1 TonB-dependent receptor [Reichenbachiella agariperforans]